MDGVPGVDLVALQDWMETNDVGAGPVELVDRLGGGTQNVMLRLRQGGRDMVLRRGPQHLRATSNDHLVRELGVVEALGRTEVPHPRVIAGCRDPEVLGDAVFYLMEPIDGFNPTVDPPPAVTATEETRRRLAFSVVDALATIGNVDHVAVGLADLGHPDGFLERQVPRWRSQLESYAELDGYGGPQLPALEQVATWLEQNRPASHTPGLMHGDFHLANVMCHGSTGDVVAVVDWEMATIGDPLLDLGWLMATWPRPGRDEILSLPVKPFAEPVGPADLVARYGQRSSRDLSAMDWYVVLACYKLGIVIEGTYARSCAGRAPRDIGERMHAAAIELFERARITAAL